MIKKRYTYAFSAFVHGVYEWNNDKSVLALLNAMTPDEKIVIRTLNYASIWAHIWLMQPSYDSQKYRHLKSKFDNAFINNNNGVRLLDLIARSMNGTRVWEIPKGRQRKQEPEIHCAVREFYEETGVEKNGYYIYPNATRTNTFVDDGVQYVQKYFIAYSDKIVQPRVNLGSHAQIEEVADIRWMSIDDIRFVDPTGRLESLVTPIFNYVKKHTFRIR